MNYFTDRKTYFHYSTTINQFLIDIIDRYKELSTFIKRSGIYSERINFHATLNKLFYAKFAENWNYRICE